MALGEELCRLPNPLIFQCIFGKQKADLIALLSSDISRHHIGGKVSCIDNVGLMPPKSLDWRSGSELRPRC